MDYKFRYFEINEEGHNIRCKLYFNDLKSVSRAVIFGTGFAGHKDNKAAEGFAEKLLSKYKGVVVIVFNWPSHGDDVKKKPTLEDCDTYLRLVLEAARTHYGAKELYAYATSFGGYLFLKYIHEHGNPFKKVVLRCPVVDMYDIFIHSIVKNDDMEKIEKGRDVPVGFDRKVLISASFLEELKENDIRKYEYIDYADDILIIHGTADNVVPCESSRSFAEDNVIEFIPVEGAEHRFINPIHMSLANKYVMNFFDFN